MGWFKKNQPETTEEGASNEMPPSAAAFCPDCNRDREIEQVTHQFGEGSILLSMCSVCGYVLERGDAVVEDTD